MIAIVYSEINKMLNLEYLDKKHGLVFAAEVEKNGALIRFPLDFGAKANNLEEAVIPDAKYRALSYFEGNAPTRAAAMNGVYTGFVSFVCWMNTEKIDMNNPNISDMIAKDLESHFKTLRGRSFEGGKVQAIRVNYIHNRNNDILAKYTYDKKKVIIAPPYDIIKLDMEIDFSYTCPNIILNPKEC